LTYPIDLLRVFGEEGPRLPGLRGDLQVDAVEQKLEVAEAFLIVFEDLIVVDHGADDGLVDAALEEGIDVGELENHLLDLPPFPVDFGLHFLQLHADAGVGLVELAPDAFQLLALAQVVLLYQFVPVRDLDWHAPFDVLNGLDAVDLPVLSLVAADEVLEVVFLEEAMRVEALQQKLVLADVVDELAALVDQLHSHCLLIYLLQLLLSDFQWVDEDEGERFGQAAS
jgi:hypothetical protein